MSIHGTVRTLHKHTHKEIHTAKECVCERERERCEKTNEIKKRGQSLNECVSCVTYRKMHKDNRDMCGKRCEFLISSARIDKHL